MTTNNETLGVPRIKMLTENQINNILEATYVVLESQGSIIAHEGAKQLLLDAGATVTEDGSKVLIPRELVKAAIDSAPKRIKLYDRDGNLSMDLGGDRCYFGISCDAVDIIDPRTAERRPTRSSDWLDWAKAVDYLPNMSFMHLCGLCEDLPADEALRTIGYYAMLNTRKTIGLALGALDPVDELIGVAEIIAGGPEKFKEKPNLFVLSQSVSPLEHPEDSIDRLLMAAERNAPLVYFGMQMQCVTSPGTGAGTIVISLAETLAGLVIHQLKNPGAPYILGGEPAAMDMRSMVFSYGSPELNRNNIAEIEVMRSLGIPTWGTSCSDAKTYDAQAGLEYGVSTMLAMMGGHNLVHDHGFLDQAGAASLQVAVLNDEMIRWCKTVMTGVDTSEEALALDVMEAVGAGGNYLKQKHSLKKYKELWTPKVFDRSADYKSVKPLEQRLEDEVRRILDTHVVPPLPDDILEKIEAHRKEWDEKAVK